MRTFLLVLRNLVIILLAVLISLASIFTIAGVVTIQRTLPQTSGSLTIAGLQRATSVVRDRWGVPRITGSNLHDVAFTQGYVTAQDRLFQMEFNRRVAQGRLAEMFGPGSDNSLVDADAFLRTLGLYRAAEQELGQLDPTAQIELQGYADGVNAYLTTHSSSLPLEFTILGVKPDPWTPQDSLGYGRVVALSLDSNWYNKFTRAMIVTKAGLDVANALYPAYPTTNPTLISATGAAVPLTPSTISPVASALPTISPTQRAAFTRLPTSVLRGANVVHSLLGQISDSLGSNNWVVDGTRTTTGLPLLANDPHLGINMPAIWYEIALRGGGLDVIGFSFPGVPGVVIGHNSHIAWGVTNVGADNTDLYLETLDPVNHPGQYEFDQRWYPLGARQETILVRGGSPVTITVNTTQHGPLLNSAFSDLKNFSPVALKWTALQQIYTFSGFFQLDFAANWPQFLAAISHIAISQNFIYADTAGNIGYRMSGLLPIRSSENDLLPVDGSRPDYEWTGYVPQDQMPTLFNPPTHIIVTANNQITAPDASLYVTAQWDQGYRARRILDLLTATPTLSSADYQRIQADTYNIPSATLTPLYIKAGLAAGGAAARAATLLAGWDGSMTRDSVAASVFEATTGILIRQTIEPLLGKDIYTRYRENSSSSVLYSALLNLLDNPSAPFFSLTPNTSLGQYLTTRDAALNHALTTALSAAIAQLSATYGPDSAHWRWGALHQARFTHPLATVSPLDHIFGVAPFTRPGDGVTVNVGGDGGFSGDTPNYDQRTVSSMRQIIDLSNLDASLWVTTTGESGQPFSAHYSDLITLWDQNRYQTMDFSPRAEAIASVAILTLTPA